LAVPAPVDTARFLETVDELGRQAAPVLMGDLAEIVAQPSRHPEQDRHRLLIHGISISNCYVLTDAF